MPRPKFDAVSGANTMPSRVSSKALARLPIQSTRPSTTRRRSRICRLKRELRPILADWWLSSSGYWSEGLLAATKEGVWEKAISAAGVEPVLEHPLRVWVALRKADREKRDIAELG